MASTETGELYTQEQYDAMGQDERDRLGIVPVTPQESATLAPMTPEERKAWLKKNKRPSRRSVNKQERQNKKKARRAQR